jgi:hypothetical protein
LSATHCPSCATDADVSVVPPPASPADLQRPEELAAITQNGPAVHPLERTVTASPIPIKLSILMAAYNEEQTIIQVVQTVLDTDYPCDMELIVVNDGSEDRTAQLLDQINDPRVIVHHHPVNQGKGAGIKSAAALATGSHILPFDADLEYAPEDIPRLLQPILRGRCNVVYGTRMFGINTVHRSYRYAAGNRLMSRLANLLFDACITDLHTCLKLIPLPMIKALTLTEDGFGLDTEITASLLRHGIRPFEVPVSYYSRSHAQGKKINWRDAVKCVQILIRVRMRRVAARPECFQQTSFYPGQLPIVRHRSAIPAQGSMPTAGSWELGPAAHQAFTEDAAEVEVARRA